MKKIIVIVVGMVAAIAEAVSYKEARDVYQNCFTNPPPGLVSGGDYLFHVFDSFPGRNERETILKDQMRVLFGYVGRPKDLKSPFEGALNDALLPFANFKLPSFQSFVVERKYHEKDVRVVTALEAAPIEAARAKVAGGLANKRTLTEWTESLRALFGRKQNDGEEEAFLNQLGTTRRLLSQMDTVTTVSASVDFLALRAAEAAWPADGADRAACRRMLSVNPIFAPALRRLAELDAAEGHALDAMANELLAGISAPDTGRVAERAKTLGTGAWQEFGALYAKFQEKDLSFGGKAPLWSAVRGTAGRVAFEKSPAAVNDMGAFVQAKELFKPYQGKDVQKDLAKAIVLLVKSIECDPANAEKWRYYAAALRAARRPREAALAYLQTLTLNANDQVAAADLVSMYEELGLKKLAEGDAWWMLMTASAASPEAKKAEAHVRRLYPDVFAD